MDSPIVQLANALGMDVMFSGRGFAVWTGKRAVWPTSIHSNEQLHEVAHFIVAAKRRRRQLNYGLGYGPNYGTKGRTVSWRNASWDERLAKAFEQSFWAWAKYGGRGLYSVHFEEEEARNDLIDRGLVYHSSSMPNWRGVFGTCGKDDDPHLLRLIRKSLS